MLISNNILQSIYKSTDSQHLNGSVVWGRGLHRVWAPVGPNANLAVVGGFTFAAGVGGQTISRETRGERWDLACNRNAINAQSWEEN